MRTVRSTDGTPIAVDDEGSGPPLVLVTGALCDRRSPAGLVPLLAGSATVHTYDRRGRGSSGDTAPYAVEREIDDLAAVIGSTGGTALVYGHSSGARLALAAAAAGVPIDRLAVYEPPFRSGTGDADAAVLRRRVEHLLEEGDRRGAVTAHLVGSGIPEPVVQQMHGAPWWPAVEALAHTLPYDQALCGDLSLPTDQLASISIPTLVLGGGASGADWRAALREVAATVPDGRYAEVPGQGHVPAHEVLAPVLAGFLTGNQAPTR
ncbi:pimeloyl-ACP methyl ester carboxylesterase [Geodermatophilus normandii]|uniref:Pimeloyl-ACP methyl ester carboxylesterase n=1 Tax=Geodermatophilus normandii TaxID=1137989 RepID=A0A317QES5_9ACTN|nr:pimeloyl-ACP methyl ester carboxylesterase [Geodermatophilus normandii]